MKVIRMQLSSFSLRAFDLLFQLLVVVTIFLPSGTIYSINFKQPLYLFLVPLALYRFFQAKATPSNLILLLGLPALLSVWFVIGMFHGVFLGGILRQYMDMVLTMLLCWLAVLYTDENETRQLSFLHLVLNAEVATCLLKLGLVAYALARGIPVAQMMNTLSGIFGVDLMTMDLGALLGRVQFVSDALIPVCIFLVLRHRARLRIGPFYTSLTIVLLAISVILSFSRYFWVFSAFALLLGLLLGRKDRFNIAVIGILTAAALVSLPALTTLYQLRFSSEVTGPSDRDRLEQSTVLQAFFFDAPILGHGLGSYTPALLRGSQLVASRYSYEMQLLALAGQVGLVGLFFFSGTLAWYYRSLWWRSRLAMSDRLGLGGMICFWLAVGWYNPMLINPVASVTYATFAVLANLVAEPKVSLGESSLITARGLVSSPLQPQA